MLRNFLTSHRTLLQNILIAVVSCILSLLVLEFFLRWYLKDPHSLPQDLLREYEYGFQNTEDSTFFYHNRFMQYTIRTGAFGLRYTTHAPDLSSEFPGILVVGDSFTFGYGVHDEHAFPAILKRHLYEMGHHVQVFNAGVPAFGTKDTFFWLKAYLDQLPVEDVILGFYVNDYKDNLQHMSVVNGYLTISKPPSLQFAIARYLMEHIVSLQFLRKRLLQSEWLRNFFLQDYYFTLDHQNAKMFIEQTIEYLDRIKHLIATQGKTFTIVCIPVEVAVYSPQEPVDFYLPVKEWCQQNTVRCLDATAYFRQQDKEGLYDPHSLHFSEAGNAVMAKYLSQILYTRNDTSLTGLSK